MVLRVLACPLLVVFWCGLVFVTCRLLCFLSVVDLCVAVVILFKLLLVIVLLGCDVFYRCVVILLLFVVWGVDCDLDWFPGWVCLFVFCGLFVIVCFTGLFVWLVIVVMLFCDLSHFKLMIVFCLLCCLLLSVKLYVCLLMCLFCLYFVLWVFVVYLGDCRVIVLIYMILV